MGTLEYFGKVYYELDKHGNYFNYSREDGRKIVDHDFIEELDKLTAEELEKALKERLQFEVGDWL